MTRAEALIMAGPMGAGKTSVGRRVSRLLSTTFFDTDAAIQRDHGPIPRIFLEHGEAHFRALEREAVGEGLATGGVVALGGGAILDQDTRRLLASHRVVLLTVEPRTVAGRIRNARRPLLATGDPLAEWIRIRDERLPLYLEVADVTFDTSHGPLQQVAERIAAWAREHTEKGEA